MAGSGEQDLLDRARGGDHAALGELLQHHEQRLYNVCLRMVGDRDDAAELTQDVMLKIIEHLDAYRGSAALSTWMIRIAMNHCVSHARRKSVRRTVSLDGGQGGVGGANGHRDGGEETEALRKRLPHDGEPDPGGRVEQREMLERLRRAVAALDEAFRPVLVLRDLEQMSYAQIGEVLELPVGTIKSRLFRARLALREQMTSINHAPAEGSSAQRPDKREF